MNAQLIDTPYGSRKFYYIKQNGPEWYELRTGMPTASACDNIVTPAKMEYSKSSERYMNHLIAERLAQHVLEFQSDAMRIGVEREEESRKAFTLATGMKVENGGFWTLEDGSLGASPDGLIQRGDQRGVLELKNPNASTHVGYMRDPSLLFKDYKIQVLTQMLVCGVDFCWLQSYYPELQSVRFLVERDAATMDVLTAHFATFTAKLNEEWQSIQKRYYVTNTNTNRDRSASL